MNTALKPLILKFASTLFTLAVIQATVSPAYSAPKIFSGVGPKASTAFESMKTAIGGSDNTLTPGPQKGGFRTIDWDGVLLDGTDFGGKTQTIIPNKTVGIPVDRFQSRGVIFEEVYAVSGDGFVSANRGVRRQFPFFSPKNIFAMFNDTEIEIEKFTLAGTNRVAKTRGFGAIFMDVEKPRSSSIEFFSGSKSLGKYYVPPGRSGQPEFLGVLWSKPIVTAVTLNVGAKTIFSFDGTKVKPGPADITLDAWKGADLAATDDFIYAEPTRW